MPLLACACLRYYSSCVCADVGLCSFGPSWRTFWTDARCHCLLAPRYVFKAHLLASHPTAATNITTNLACVESKRCFLWAYGQVLGFPIGSFRPVRLLCRAALVAGGCLEKYSVTLCCILHNIHTAMIHTAMPCL